MKASTQSHIYLLIAAILFGGNYVIGKRLMPDPFNPQQIIIIRMLAATIIFSIIAKFYNFKAVERKDLIRLAFCALFGVTLNQILFFTGLEHTTPINAAIIHTSSPILVLVFAAILIKEKVTLKKLIGIALGLSGAYLIITEGRLEGLDSSLFYGNIIVFLNITAYSLYLVLVKPLFEKYNPLLVMKWIYSFGLLMAIPFTIQSTGDIKWSTIEIDEWLSLGYLIVGTSIIGYLLISKALKHINASIVGFYVYLQPIFATIFAYMLGSGDLSLLKIASMGMIFSGIYFINEKKAV